MGRHRPIERFLFFWAETVIALVESIVWIPIGEAARGGVSLTAEHADIFLVHSDKGVVCQW